ncbi:MAG: type I restriction-modification system subunit M [Spirochaetales bacterium]|nr:type I restriction-modification system subunit M [Spirochaetales bacterium]
MNKQQLASKIWESANKMRSKIEANEYKDYILGFIFYKFLSDQELRFLRDDEWDEDSIRNLTEEDAESVDYIRNNLGYFIPYDRLFSTWIEKKADFTSANVIEALNSFSNSISSQYKNVFRNIFITLETGIKKLGDTSQSLTRAIRDLVYLIKDIPTDGKQDYDVLGFIYEYLISNFAANAGKKAGEFYTPHEVSTLIAEIVSYHLKENETIKIYDPTSGSGSLLITIGKAAKKYIRDEEKIKYFAQELKENTFNLTRMNLVMRGIKPSNIDVRNADTLHDDWPIENGYDPLRVDAVVSNPPYSQEWNPENRENDARYSQFGLAPTKKADYAFLLHCLFHVEPHGIMAIVLPHGVLFRGGTEEEIRTNLIEKNHIDTIIGLPPNIFFGTGIPTIVMVLRRQRPNTDVLIIDASKRFEKKGKNNVLRASDIKKIADIVQERKSEEKFSRVVSVEEIRANNYNLNIPRYVDSSEDAEKWDIYALMCGGVPVNELQELSVWWRLCPAFKKLSFPMRTMPM